MLTDFSAAFILILLPGTNAVSLFAPVFDKISHSISPGKPFQPSLMFVSKARAYSSGTLES
jgi:hypothetical protein